MNKHVFGLLIFGLIVFLTAVGYAVFYRAPMPQIAEIDEVFVENAKPTSCFPGLKSHITSEVESVAILTDENKLIAKIKLNWHGDSAPPPKIYVGAETFTPENISNTVFKDSQLIAAPFKNGGAAEIMVEYKISNWKNFDPKQNYYAAFDVSESDADAAAFSIEKKKSRAHSVVLAHGKNSAFAK